MNQNYLDVLENSLIKKCHILDEIKKINCEQKEALSSNNVQLEIFDAYISKKAECIEKLEMLDQGFEALYKQVEDELKINRNLYSEQIKRMQDLIKEITDKSASIQVQELRNKDLIAEYFLCRRSEIRDGRRSAKVAMDYYKVQSNSSFESQFMDSKS